MEMLFFLFIILAIYFGFVLFVAFSDKDDSMSFRDKLFWICLGIFFADAIIGRRDR